MASPNVENVPCSYFAHVAQDVASPAANHDIFGQTPVFHQLTILSHPSLVWGLTGLFFIIRDDTSDLVIWS